MADSHLEPYGLTGRKPVHVCCSIYTLHVGLLINTYHIHEDAITRDNRDKHIDTWIKDMSERTDEREKRKCVCLIKQNKYHAYAPTARARAHSHSPHYARYEKVCSYKQPSKSKKPTYENGRICLCILQLKMSEI